MASAREALVQTLGDSASQVDHARVRDATVRLEEWRTQPGFFVALQVRTVLNSCYSLLKHIFSTNNLEYILIICFFVYDFENMLKSRLRIRDIAATCF